ncbi:MAG: hypothetical protein HZB14_09580, partial [Actinobacteria bacterium]|nr:hypothetical protein [Actinomycetota bacterium]
MLPRLLVGTCAKSSLALFLALVVIALALPASASADLTHGLTVTTSDSTAGAHPDLGLDLTFGGSEAPDALSLTLPSGLNIAPAAIASPCTNSQVLANSCPVASQIGTAALTGTGGVSGNGTLYMTESPVSGGLAGIAAVVDMGASGIWTAQGSLSLSNLGESTLTQKIIFEPLPGT